MVGSEENRLEETGSEWSGRVARLTAGEDAGATFKFVALSRDRGSVFWILNQARKSRRLLRLGTGGAAEVCCSSAKRVEVFYFFFRPTTRSIFRFRRPRPIRNQVERWSGRIRFETG